MFFHPGMEGSLGFSYVDTATAARDLVYDTGFLLEWILIFTLINCLRRVDDDRKTVLISYRLHTLLTSLLSPATYRMKAFARGSSAGSAAALSGLLAHFTKTSG